ncbi:hypothetical protein Q5692_17025 [Microcoleus sp. C2C3]|uniref:hypothetical protein n=1 Tax=unclassified Microcoleus TaxID=2642155 RepID=UPI002FD6A024
MSINDYTFTSYVTYHSPVEIDRRNWQQGKKFDSFAKFLAKESRVMYNIESGILTYP